MRTYVSYIKYLRKEICLLQKIIYSFISRELWKTYSLHIDGGTWYDDEACNIVKLRLKHSLHSSLEKNLMERVNQYFKDRRECFDDYYPCIQNECNLFHVHNWIQFFVSMYNDAIYKDEFIINLQ